MNSMDKHAFLILAHNDLYCLNKLIGMLDHERNDIYVHVDIKAKEIDPNKIVTKYSKIIFIDRVDVYWGDFSLVKVELRLFETAYQSNNNYLYYHLLSGVDLPIKGMNYIHTFFDENKGTEFISFREDYAAYERTYRYLFFMKYEKHPNRYVSIFFSKLRYILGNNIYKILGQRRKIYPKYKSGDQWVSITNDMVRFILENKSKIYTAFKYTKCADEVYKQTIIYNSVFVNKIYNSDTPETKSLRYADWSRMENNSSPHVFDINDKDMLINTSCLFARKFSSKTIDRIKLVDWVVSRWGNNCM